MRYERDMSPCAILPICQKLYKQSGRNAKFTYRSYACLYFISYIKYFFRAKGDNFIPPKYSTYFGNTMELLCKIIGANGTAIGANHWHQRKTLSLASMAQMAPMSANGSIVGTNVANQMTPLAILTVAPNDVGANKIYLRHWCYRQWCHWR